MQMSIIHQISKIFMTVIYKCLWVKIRRVQTQGKPLTSEMKDSSLESIKPSLRTLCFGGSTESDASERSHHHRCF